MEYIIYTFNPSPPMPLSSLASVQGDEHCDISSCVGCNMPVLMMQDSRWPTGQTCKTAETNLSRAADHVLESMVLDRVKNAWLAQRQLPARFG